MSPERPPLTAGGRADRNGAVLALLAFVFFVRAWLIKVWGSPVPYADQWDAEALQLFRPWLEGTWRWSDFFAAHNEHRIALTRLADLALFLLSGRWNPWGQLLLNAALHAGTAALLAWICWTDLSRPFRPGWLLGVALLFIAPAGWQNALWGFQSHVFFGNLLAVVAFAALFGGPALSLGWWLGWMAALLALLTNASGLFTAAVALFLSAVGLFRSADHGRKTSPAPAVISLLALGFIVALGVVLRVEVPDHGRLHAHSVARFSAVFFRCLSWPWVDSAWWWLVMQAPLVWTWIGVIRRRAAPRETELFAVALGSLAVLHAAAIAYTRGSGLFEGRPLSRYHDPLLLGAGANLFLLLRFAGQGRPGRIATLFWSGAALAGILTLTTTNLSLDLPFKRYQDQKGLTQIRAYLTTHDANVFTADQPRALLHPDPTVVQRSLDDPLLRPVLPEEFFDASVHPPWAVRSSPWLALLSGVGLVLVAIRCGSRPKE